MPYVNAPCYVRGLAIRNPHLLDVARCEGCERRPALYEFRHGAILAFLCEPCMYAATGMESATLEGGAAIVRSVHLPPRPPRFPAPVPAWNRITREASS